jgi:heme/copper-type cytochrome/quinol oxidase subunit 1
MKNNIATVITVLGLLLAVVTGVAGGVLAFEMRVESKIDRAIGPIKADVSAIRKLLEVVVGEEIKHVIK